MDFPDDSFTRRAVGIASLGAGNILAIGQSLDLAAISGGLTVLFLSLAGGITVMSGSRDRAATSAAAARLKIEADAAAAKLRIDAAAASAALKIYRDAELARIEMELERDSKLGPTLKAKLDEMTGKLAEMTAKLADAELTRDKMEGKLDSISTGQSAIRKAIQPRVLVVDDDEDTCRLMKSAIAAKGYDCQSVGTVAEARTLLASCRFAWVILDMILPDGSGLDLLREIKVRSKLAKVAAITGYAGADVLAEADAAMADISMSKPVDPAKLIARMRALADKSPRPHQSDVDLPRLSGSGSGDEIAIEKGRP